MKKSEYLDFACELALECGKIIKKEFFEKTEHVWKEDNSPLTKTDALINSLVIKRIKSAYPEHDIQGEEESNMKNNSSFVWVCDPIDGTRAFIMGVPLCTFSLALVEKGQPIIGVAYDPFMDRLYYAEKDKGAYMNENKIEVNNKKELKTTMIGTHYAPYSILPMANISIDLLNKGFRIFDLTSAVYTGFLVASGKLSGMIFPYKYLHDVAAIKVIIEEAGGKTSDMFGNAQNYIKEINCFVASNGIIHDTLIECIKKNKDKIKSQ